MAVVERRVLRQLVSRATHRLLLKVAEFPIKHPVRSDFDTAVTEAGVSVTFKPANSNYSFYRLAESEDVARLGPVSPGGDTKDYSPDEVQEMARQIAAEAAASVWSVQDEEGADKLTLRGHSIGGDDVR
jgi:hypothetical protein